MKQKYITYLVFLGLFSTMIITSLYNHVFNYDFMVQEYAKLGYPEHLIKPLAVLQFFGLLIILTNKGKWLVEWAYGAFFLNMAFAIIAHYVAKEGNGAAAVICLLLLWTTYSLHKSRKEAEVKEKLQLA